MGLADEKDYDKLLEDIQECAGGCIYLGGTLDATIVMEYYGDTVAIIFTRLRGRELDGGEQMETHRIFSSFSEAMEKYIIDDMTLGDACRKYILDPSTLS